MPSTHISPNSWIFLRLPNNSFRPIEITPNTIIEVGKLGSFPSNLLLGRPYHFMYELLEKRDGEAFSRLRVVTPTELNAEIVAEDATPAESRGEPADDDDEAEADAVQSETKNNRLTIDQASRQALSQHEIEELKKSAAGSEVIEKLLAGHGALDEKTAFSRAKYMVRKRSKYLKRFTVLPMEIGTLIDWLMEKELGRILEMREETLGLVTAWSNAHSTPAEEDGEGKNVGGGRWLVVDDAGGLLVAALAERMGILHELELEEDEDADVEQTAVSNGASEHAQTNGKADDDGNVEMASAGSPANGHATTIGTTKPKPNNDFPPPASHNTLTLLHPATQPNVSLLKYFGYDTNAPSPKHPLHTHLKPLSWLQLLHPEEDPTYIEPPIIPDSTLKEWKSAKRSNYWKKRRRWARCRAIVDETREGGFDGLVIATRMDLVGVLRHLVPLVRGGGHIVVYAPTVEPLVHVMDLYSKERRSAFTTLLASANAYTPHKVQITADDINKDDFPLDPRLLLAPTLQTTRIREWQVLPGRTHPLMTSKGGSEGYVFTARKVLPLEGGVEARGNFSGKKRKGGAGAGEADGGP